MADTKGVEDKVAAHYGAGGLLERVLNGLRAAGADLTALRPADLRPFDSLHVGGWPATEHLLARLDIAPGCDALDVGCGIGGTARALAQQYGAHVWGVDSTPEFVEAATRLTRMAGVQGVTFQVASGTDLPFEDARFDLATMLHVGMNLPDKARVLAEVSRVLRPGGKFGVYDTMRVGPGEIAYPMPWAATAATSFVATPEEYLAAAKAAGLRAIAQNNRGAEGLAHFEALRAEGSERAKAPWVPNLTAAIQAGALAPIELILVRD